MYENGTLSFFLTDNLGSTAITVSDSGSRTGDLHYSAWGDTPTTHRYTGQAQAEALGFYFSEARWYDNYLGRWTQPDSTIPYLYNP